MNLQTELAPQHKSGLLLKNPVMMATGIFGYGVVTRGSTYENKENLMMATGIFGYGVEEAQ